MDKKEEKIDINTYTNVALEGAAAEVVQRYGSAVKEHSVAYTGVDNEAGKTLKRGLKKTASSKVNPEYERQNILQQSGYAAEDKYVARQNAEKIINGDTSRTTRTDDVGRVNDPLYDHITLEEDGWVVPGSGEQMKFVGGDAKECLSKLRSKKFEKYLEADATITVPSDYYEGILSEADTTISRLEKQLERAKASGDQDLIAQKEKEIAKVKKIKSNLKNSGITTEEAKEARLHPKLSTAKDMGRLAHRAGVEQAKTGAVISGSVSLVSNIVAVIKGEKDAKTAGWDVVKDTGAGAAMSYSTAFAGSLIKGGMQNAGSKTVQALSKTNLPAIVVTSSYEMGKTLKNFVTGKIDGVQCLEELGEKGTGQISSALFAAVGQAAIPIPVVGAIIGSMAGYALSSACYKSLTDALKDAKLAREERIRIEKECGEAVAMINVFHKEMNEHIQRYLSDHKQTFNDALNQLSIANGTNDVDLFIASANKVTNKLGGKTSFNSFDEFDALMNTEGYTFKQ